MIANILRRCRKTVASPHFWVVAVLFAVCIILHYPQQILATSSPSLFSSLGLSRHAVERIFLLLPIGYASFYLGTPAGLVSLALATVVMLPRVFLISEYFPDALFETIEVIIIGGLVNFWFVYYRNEKRQKQQMLSNLKEANERLQDHAKALETSHRQLKESQEQVIQAEKLTSLGQMAASIAHEVNNPLSGTLVYNQLLAKKIIRGEADDKVTLDYLSKMENELVRSTKLIQNLLNFARQSPPEFHLVDLNVVVNQGFDLISHTIEKNKIQVRHELDPSLPKITADANQLQQVCINLILNAIQAMPQGGKLTLRTYVQNARVKLEIEDTGIGIPPENMSKLFTPFFSTKPEVKGVGLGLPVAYGIIQRHQGRIEVRSKVGEGSTFTVSLPLHPKPVKTE